MTDVTFRAFRALVDYIYGKPLDRLEMIFLWEKVTKCFDKHLDRVFFDVLGLEAAARLLELAYAAEKYQVRINICLALNFKCTNIYSSGENPD